VHNSPIPAHTFQRFLTNMYNQRCTINRIVAMCHDIDLNTRLRWRVESIPVRYNKRVLHFLCDRVQHIFRAKAHEKMLGLLNYLFEKCLTATKNINILNGLQSKSQLYTFTKDMNRCLNYNHLSTEIQVCSK
jgi:hypothetical protein